MVRSTLSVGAEVADEARADAWTAAADDVRVRRRWNAFLRNRGGVAGGVFLLAIVVVAVFAPLIAPYDPTKTDLLHRFVLPTGLHPLGTDDLGRDVLSRVLYASRLSMLAGVGSVAVSLVVALPIGLLAGYYGGRIDGAVVVLVDIILSVPPLILVFAIAGVLGASLGDAIIALAVYFSPVFIRLIRTEVLRVRQSQLVEAEKAVGVSDVRILREHILPNIVSSLIVQTALSIGTALLAEASLSFLGLGVKPPAASWGVMLRTAYDAMTVHPWLVVVPSVAIAATVLSWNLLADGLRQGLGRVEG